jgi:hypothetical protein
MSCSTHPQASAFRTEPNVSLFGRRQAHCQAYTDSLPVIKTYLLTSFNLSLSATKYRRTALLAQLTSYVESPLHHDVA